MSKHIDLIAVGALLLAFTSAARVHDTMQLHFVNSRMFRVHTLSPIVVVPPHMPAAPHMPRLPHLPRV